mmetsp:Transcript_15728/g.34971  ORF Transcript_15728/g.34971 Transcript_15728/m.34971 type:complete len:227 (-) Transcript_15728:341-1021(-)
MLPLLFSPLHAFSLRGGPPHAQHTADRLDQHIGTRAADQHSLPHRPAPGVRQARVRPSAQEGGDHPRVGRGCAVGRSQAQGGPAERFHRRWAGARCQKEAHGAEVPVLGCQHQGSVPGLVWLVHCCATSDQRLHTPQAPQVHREHQRGHTVHISRQRAPTGQGLPKARSVPSPQGLRNVDCRLGDCRCLCGRWQRSRLSLDPSHELSRSQTPAMLVVVPLHVARRP